MVVCICCHASVLGDMMLDPHVSKDTNLYRRPYACAGKVTSVWHTVIVCAQTYFLEHLIHSGCVVWSHYLHWQLFII